MILPLNNCKVTSEYGVVRSDKKLHKGIDMISTSGDRNVKAIRSGVVRVTHYDKDGFGNYISVQQEDGFRALYCHLEKVLVKPGDTIEEGQVIGIEGTSGNSTGVHLHLELRKSPYDIDDHIDVSEYLGIKNEEGPINYIDNYDLLEFLGIMDFWRQGYKGKGITIASRESEKTEHGGKVAEVLRMVAPEATILFDVDYKDDIEDLSPFNIYTSSLSFNSDTFPKNQNKAKELFYQDRFLVCSVGNDSDEGQCALSKNDYFISIGACILSNGEPKRTYYSSITEDIDYMSLTDLELSDGKFSGTSCAAPLFAGMCALVQCWYLMRTGRTMNNEELLNFIHDNLTDLDKEGHDVRTGHGLFVLPKPWSINFEKYLSEEEEDMPRYNNLAEVPEWGKTTIEKLMNLEVLKGDENGNLNLSYDLLRTLVIHDRLGFYD